MCSIMLHCFKNKILKANLEISGCIILGQFGFKLLVYPKGGFFQESCWIFFLFAYCVSAYYNISQISLEQIMKLKIAYIWANSCLYQRDNFGGNWLMLILSTYCAPSRSVSKKSSEQIRMYACMIFDQIGPNCPFVPKRGLFVKLTDTFFYLLCPILLQLSKNILRPFQIN